MCTPRDRSPSASPDQCSSSAEVSQETDKWVGQHTGMLGVHGPSDHEDCPHIVGRDVFASFKHRF